MLRQLSSLRDLTTALIALALAACASSAPYSQQAFSDPTPLMIDAENRNWWDMEVEIDADGTRFRLGVAPSYGRVRFGVSATKLGGARHFRLIANPMDTGREAFSTVTGQGVVTTPDIDLLDHRDVYWAVGSSETTTRLIVR